MLERTNTFLDHVWYNQHSSLISTFNLGEESEWVLCTGLKQFTEGCWCVVIVPKGGNVKISLSNKPTRNAQKESMGTGWDVFQTFKTTSLTWASCMFPPGYIVKKKLIQGLSIVCYSIRQIYFEGVSFDTINNSKRCFFGCSMFSILVSCYFLCYWQ